MGLNHEKIEVGKSRDTLPNELAMNKKKKKHLHTSDLLFVFCDKNVQIRPMTVFLSAPAPGSCS